MPDLCCVGSDLQLSYSQTCTLLKTLTQTLTHRLTLLNLSHRYGSAWRSVGCVWSWLLSLGLVLQEFISIFSSGEVLSLSTLLLSPFMMYAYVCVYVCMYVHVCVCARARLRANTSIFMCITSCTSSLGVFKPLLLHIIFRCPLTESSDFLCLRSRCPELVFRSVFPTYDFIQEARWEPNWFWIQMASFKKMCSYTLAISFSWTWFWSLHLI